jgi:predicted nucleic acid-binding protein
LKELRWRLEAASYLFGQGFFADAVSFQLAIEDRIPIYDALFLAAAERETVPLLTRDEKFYELEKSTRNVRMV